MNAVPSLLTGIDLPAAPSCGSMILCSDTYGALTGQFHTTFLALPPIDPDWRYGFAALLTCRAAKKPYGLGFPDYVDAITSEVSDHVARYRPDLIHAQHLGFGLSLAFARASGSIPMLALAHGTDVIAAQESEQALSAMTEIVAASRAVVAPTEHLRARIDDLTNHRFTDRLRAVPWGIPTLSVRPMRPRRNHTGALRLLHAGRLDANKSTITAIEALALTHHPHELTVIGSGNELSALIRAAHALDLDDRVHFEPFTSREELWTRFADADGFLFTTRGLEAFGLVAVEAQAHGLSVIYADLPGMHATLGGAGLPYIPADPADLAHRIDLLAAEPALRANLARAGADNAARYDVRTTARRIAELSLRLLNDAPASGPMRST